MRYLAPHPWTRRRAFKVYERVTGKGGGTGGWVLPGSGSGSTGGRGGGEEADGGGRVGGVGGEGGGDFAEDRVRAAERLKITVREVTWIHNERIFSGSVRVSNSLWFAVCYSRCPAIYIIPS